MLTGALLGILAESGTAIITLVEGVEAEEFFRSRLTKQTVQRYLLGMSDSAGNLEKTVKTHMAEIDWAGWAGLGRSLKSGDAGQVHEAMWFAIQSLVPATLLWLRVYRKNEPQLFSYSN